MRPSAGCTRMHAQADGLASERQEVRSPSRQCAYLAANIASDLAAEIASHVWEQVLGDLRRGKQLDDFGAP
jgi:hypothetical protein